MNVDKKFFSKVGFNYLIYGIASIIIQVIIINILGLLNSNLIYDFNSLTIISAICNYILPFPILIYLMGKIDSQTPEKNTLTVKRFITYIAVTLTLMWAGNIIGLAITAFISFITPFDVSNPVQSMINSSDIWLNLMLISIIGPIFEEIFFRKLLIDRTMKYGAKASILVSALLFGLFHGNLNQFFYAFLIGGFFAYVYIRTGKIKYTILLHIIVNLMGSVVSLFVVSGVEHITSGFVQPLDIAIVVLYIMIIFASFLIGIIKLSGFKNVRIAELPGKIILREPVKTIILNPGMILFIGFSIALMIRQIIA
ncbi:MAG: CPBP family intramembrane glutamic endopeptidase [Methanobrevibacter sp.]|uniref:CPBP family intramembrane glutamic endopeptidase n=1 Tax=Methanobrevibacter sp. TaxID=66852 RepID=UPI002E766B45|nr:CPBP family intramembrane glutamic endopeptidase [Methanobrevibacter sp.]MEE0936293.1 CPBP family intramembrane glutamic endopeptidase [Methanobrevibacter sp.]